MKERLKGGNKASTASSVMIVEHGAKELLQKLYMKLKVMVISGNFLSKILYIV